MTDTSMPDRLRALADSGHPRARDLHQAAEMVELAADAAEGPDDPALAEAWEAADGLLAECLPERPEADELYQSVSDHGARVARIVTGYAPDRASIADYLRATADEIEDGKAPWGADLRTLILVAERADGSMCREVVGRPIDTARVTGLMVTAAVLGTLKGALDG